jgi:hypothetical protein
MYSEYYSGLYLLAIVGALLVLASPRRREVIVFGAIPLLAFLPWTPELIRSLDDLGNTKLNLPSSGISAHMIRDALVTVFFGEHGSAASTALRSLQALGVIAALAYASVRLRATASRDAFWLLAGVMITVVCLYLLVTAVGTDIFRARYLSTVTPLAAAVLAGALASWRWRPTVPAAAALLSALAIVIVVVRAGREYEPDTAAAVAVARDHGYRVILTNSPEVAFYGRHLDVILDRPFGLGPGLTGCARCAVIDDARFGGVRPGADQAASVGPIDVAFPPPRR